MMTQSLEEEKLNAMQRVWHIRRGHSFIFDEVPETEDILSLNQNLRTCGSTENVASFSCAEPECQEPPKHEDLPKQDLNPKAEDKPSYLKLNAADIGDIPAQYTICNVDKHQMPVAGLYIDPRVVPGFKYRVRPLPTIGQKPTIHRCLFNDRALTLTSIGRGYSRRFTFEADKNKLSDNNNYFWSDNRNEGYAFELELLSEGDKFTIYDLNDEPQGILEVLKTEGNQVEISNSITASGIEKRAKVQFAGKVEFFETGVAKPMPLSGIAVAVKARNKPSAEVTKVTHIVIKRCKYVLKLGIKAAERRVTVKGQDINDIPTKYTMTGLQPYEIPVVGTYVDPRIIPGFYYRIRPNDRKEHLFDGKILKLMSIGMGYAKRLTFESDSKLESNNYLWSDSHPDGLGLEPRAVHEGMKFIVSCHDKILGEAQVFRADRPQIEERMEKVVTKSGKYAIEKYIQVDVMCMIKLTPLGTCTTETEHLMRIHGIAVVRKEPNSLDSKVLRVERIGLDSVLEVLFRQTLTGFLFLPKN